MRTLKQGEYLVFFNMIWSNDTTLMCASHFGGPSNRFENYCYRIEFKNPNIDAFEYCYIVNPFFLINKEFDKLIRPKKSVN
jgi:hypothetical protein